jgi:hypothetical protein
MRCSAAPIVLAGWLKSDSEVQTPTLTVPQVSDFELISPISRGAYGRVYKVRKRTTGEGLISVFGVWARVALGPCLQHLQAIMALVGDATVKGKVSK